MVKGVADTNVYISALNFGGIADEVLALARTKVIVVFISPPILKEIGDVLIRKFNWSPHRVQAALTTIEAFTELVHPTEKLEVIQDDEPDNRILECALEAQVDFVVSGDKHLQKLRTFRGVTILSPRELLEAKGDGSFWHEVKLTLFSVPKKWNMRKKPSFGQKLGFSYPTLLTEL